eukprot:364196-Chlamydomonas_euryale.AAC.3
MDASVFRLRRPDSPPSYPPFPPFPPYPHPLSSPPPPAPTSACTARHSRMHTGACRPRRRPSSPPRPPERLRKGGWPGRAARGRAGSHAGAGAKAPAV